MPPVDDLVETVNACMKSSSPDQLIGWLEFVVKSRGNMLERTRRQLIKLLAGQLAIKVSEDSYLGD